MNNINTKKISVLVVTTGMFCLVLSSCTKIEVNPTQTPITALSVTQASSDVSVVDVVVDNTKINSLGLLYGQSTGYIGLSPGKGTITFINDVTTAPIITDSVDFIQNTMYSAFLVNATTSPSVFLTKDTLNKPASGFAGIRFIDLSPDAPAVDLVVQGGATLVSNRSFEGFSSFVPLAAGNSYTFEIHQTGTTKVLATLSKTGITAGYLYTIWFHGLAAGTTAGNQLAVDIITNTYF